MTRTEEAVFEAKAEREFAGHRSPPSGRNFLAFEMRFHGGKAKDAYDMGVCRTFPNAPGSRMCGACMVEDCDMRMKGVADIHVGLFADEIKPSVDELKDVCAKEAIWHQKEDGPDWNDARSEEGYWEYPDKSTVQVKNV